MIFKGKINIFLSGFLAVIICTLIYSMPTNAEYDGTLVFSKTALNMQVGEVAYLTVDYSKTMTTFSDLTVVSSNPGIASAVMAEGGNGKAVVAVIAQGKGTASVAVHRVSNPGVVAYCAISSGLAAKNEVYTDITGNLFTTYFEDCVAQYPAVLTGKNGATFSVTGFILNRKSGMNKLEIHGELLTGDEKLPGMSTFYVDFYGFGGDFLNTQAIYVREPKGANRRLTLETFVPDDAALMKIQ